MKRISIVFIICLGIASGENLIFNPGFEDWLFFGDLHMPARWVTSELTSPGSADTTTEIVHSGAYALKLVGSDTMAFASTGVQVSPNTPYRFSGWAQGPGLLAGTFSLTWVDSSFAVIGSPVLVPIIAAKNYHQYSVKTTSPTSAAGAIITILSQPAETLYVDDMGLEPQSSIAEAQMSPPLQIEASPNPTTIRTGITFTIKGLKDFNLMIYDRAGRLVRTYPASSSIVYWNGKDDTGKNVTAGFYFVKVLAKDFNMVIKVLILR